MTKSKRRARGSTRPKGSYPLPTGGYISAGSWGPPDKRGRRLRIRAVHRAEVDPKAIAQVLIALAIEKAQAERERKRTS
jgi:hypothetical protein